MDHRVLYDLNFRTDIINALHEADKRREAEGLSEGEAWDAFKKHTLKLLRRHTRHAKRKNSREVRIALHNLNSYDKRMSRDAPSAEAIAHRNFLQQELQAKAQQALIPSNRRAWEKVRRQERCTFDFTRAYKADFEPQRIRQLVVVPDWHDPEEVKEAFASPEHSTGMSELLEEITKFYSYIFEDKPTTA